MKAANSFRIQVRPCCTEHVAVGRQRGCYAEGPKDAITRTREEREATLMNELDLQVAISIFMRDGMIRPRPNDRPA